MTWQPLASLGPSRGLSIDEVRREIRRTSLSAQQLVTGTLRPGVVVQSSDFVSGTSGWQIDGDGNAEFNDVTIRGTIYATAGEISGSLTMTGGAAIYMNSLTGDRGVLKQTGSNLFIGAYDNTDSITVGFDVNASTGGVTFYGDGVQAYQYLFQGGVALDSGFTAVPAPFLHLYQDHGGNGGGIKFYDDRAGNSPVHVASIDYTASGDAGLTTKINGVQRLRVATTGIYVNGAVEAASNVLVASLGKLGWSNEASTFIDKPTTGTIRFAVGGSEKGRWDSSDGLRLQGVDSNGHVLLTFQTARPWQVRQVGTGAGAHLQFYCTTAGKYVEFSDSLGNLLLRTPSQSASGGQGFQVPWSYNNTTASGANLNVQSTGIIIRSTSSREVKHSIATLKDLPRFRPVRFRSKLEADGEREYAGFIAEEVAEAFPLAGMDDGQNYDVRAIVAVHEARIQKLERKLEELAA